MTEQPSPEMLRELGARPCGDLSIADLNLLLANPDPDAPVVDSGCCCATGLHVIDCIVTARTQPHAMVNDLGAVFYPDNQDDALRFATYAEAWPVNFLAFMRWWVSNG